MGRDDGIAHRCNALSVQCADPAAIAQRAAKADDVRPVPHDIGDVGETQRAGKP